MRCGVLVRTRSAIAAVLLAAVAGGCSVPFVSGDTWTLTGTFEDVINLPDGAAVKLGGVVIGEVVDIRANDSAAEVTMRLDDGIELREGTDFRLRYTTALGEVYVDVTPAAKGALLTDGTELSIEETSTAPTVEDMLASASLLVNGGSLAQVQTIASELNTALDGRTDAARTTLREMDTFLGQVLRSRDEVDRLLSSLVSASGTLDARQETINKALRDLRPAAETISDNTDDIVRLLRSTNRLARTSQDLVLRTEDDVRSVVNELGPVLDTLLDIEAELLRGLSDLNTLASRLDAGVPNDYGNLRFVLGVEGLLGAVPGTPPVPGDPGSPPLDPGIPSTPPLLPLPGLVLPGLPLDLGSPLGGLLGGAGGGTP